MQVVHAQELGVAIFETGKSEPPARMEYIISRNFIRTELSVLKLWSAESPSEIEQLLFNYGIHV